MEEVPTWVAGGAAEKWAAEKTEAAEKGRKRRKKGRKEKKKKKRKREKEAAKAARGAESDSGSDSDVVLIDSPPAKKPRAKGADTPKAKASLMHTQKIGSFFRKPKSTAPAPAPSPAMSSIANTDAQPAQAPVEGPAAPTPPTDTPAPTPAATTAAVLPKERSKYKATVGGGSTRAEEAKKAGLDVNAMAKPAPRSHERRVEVNTGGAGIKLQKPKSIYTDLTKCKCNVFERAKQYKDESFIVTGGNGVPYGLLCRACGTVMPDTLKQPSDNHCRGKRHKGNLAALEAKKETQTHVSTYLAQVADNLGSKLSPKVRTRLGIGALLPLTILHLASLKRAPPPSPTSHPAPSLPCSGARVPPRRAHDRHALGVPGGVLGEVEAVPQKVRQAGLHDHQRQPHE